MQGKIVMITGGSAGIGLATAIGLAQMGAHLIVVGRDQLKGEFAVQTLLEQGAAGADFYAVDLLSQAAIWRFALDIQQRYSRLDVLINNAAATFNTRAETEDHIEATLAAGHVAPFLLTLLLMPLLERSAPARIINVNSEAHRLAKAPLENDLQCRQNYSMMKAYSRTKLINLIWSYALSKRIQASGVTVNALHPGVAKTTLTSLTGAPFWFRAYVNLYSLWSTPKSCAQTSIYLASSPNVEKVTGKYFKNSVEARSSRWSYDEVLGSNVWDLSVNLTGTARSGKSIGAATAPPGLRSN